jgi:hypothetical protein
VGSVLANASQSNTVIMIAGSSPAGMGVLGEVTAGRRSPPPRIGTT